MNGQIGTALLWLQVERRSVGAGQVGLDVVWTGPRWREWLGSRLHGTIEAGFELKAVPYWSNHVVPGSRRSVSGTLGSPGWWAATRDTPLFREVFQTLGRV
jgi:hypothetical protein